MTDHATDIDVTHVRQARRGRHAFIILICSMALGVIVLAAVFTTYFSGLRHLHGNREAEPAVARSVTAGPSTVRQTTGG